MATRGKIDADVARMIERLQAGDSDTWADFVTRYRKLIYSAIVRASARFDADWDETAMEEIFEEALYKLLRRNGRALASWKGDCKLETWIYRIVRNVCIDFLRKRSRRRECDEIEQDREEPATRGTGSHERIGNRDLRMSLEQAIARSLSSREAVVVKLIYFEGFTYREVAEQLATTVGAMSGLVYRALAKLRQDRGVSRYWEER